MKGKIGLAIFVTGFSGIVAQLILLRELLIIFAGNEFSIGIILANWLVTEAIGCYYIGRKAEFAKNKVLIYAVITVLFAIFLPMMVFSTRVLRNIIGLSIGEAVGILPVFFSSFVILLPLSLLHGSLFTFGCKVYSSISPHNTQNIGKVYSYEILGTMVGGVCWTYVLINYLNALQITFGLAFLNFLLGCLLLVPLWRKRNILHKVVVVLTLVLTFFTIYSFFSSKVDWLHKKSIELQWKGQDIVHYQNSIYGNITVMKTDGHYTFFLDGIPHITIPVPDIVFIEEFVHLPLLTHPLPEDILILSGGAGGVINEILKYPTIKNIEYTELDPLLLELLKKYSTELTENELYDSRVKVRHIDGRLFLKTTENKFDIIMVGLKEPHDLQSNRFFTKEFFSLVDAKLQDPGLTVICLPGSMTYLSQELKDLNSSLFHTLKTVFPYVRVIPGESINIFIAANSDEISFVDMKGVIKRFSELEMQTERIIPWHIENKLNPGWVDWFLNFVEGASEKVNQDFKPISLFYSISNWNAVFNPSLRNLFRWLEKIDLKTCFLIFSILCLIILYLGIKNKLSPRSGIVFCIGTTGFTGMMLDLVMIFVFQVIYGYVFTWIGMLITFFMTGAALGAILMTKKLPRINNSLRLFITIEILAMLYILSLPLIFISIRSLLHIPVFFNSMRVFFLFLSVLSGLTVGVQFPLANQIYLKSEKNISKTAGLLYGSDLIGGWIAGIIGSVFLLPVLGILETCIVLILIKTSSLLLLLTSKKK